MLLRGEMQQLWGLWVPARPNTAFAEDAGPTPPAHPFWYGASRRGDAAVPNHAEPGVPGGRRAGLVSESDDAAASLERQRVRDLQAL
jgi:hypothetical protein